MVFLSGGRVTMDGLGVGWHIPNGIAIAVNIAINKRTLRKIFIVN